MSALAARRSAGDCHADVVELRVEDVAAMRCAAHPRGDNRSRRAAVSPAPAQVLPYPPAPVALEVAAAEDALDHVRAVGLRVREVAVLDHVARVTRGGAAQVGAQPELAAVVQL